MTTPTILTLWIVLTTAQVRPAMTLVTGTPTPRPAGAGPG